MLIVLEKITDLSCTVKLLLVRDSPDGAVQTNRDFTQEADSSKESASYFNSLYFIGRSPEYGHYHTAGPSLPGPPPS